MQCACAILSTVTCPAAPYFSILSHKRHEFREKIVELKLRVLIFSLNLPEPFIILRRNERDIIKNIQRSACKIHVIVVRF
jgi:hypothetical protein